MADGKRGRDKKPLSEKKQSKSYRPDRSGEPSMEVGGRPVMPSHLYGEARRLWKSVVPELIKAGCVGAIDRSELTAMCEWWQLYRSSRDAGDVVDAKRAYEQFARCSARFGLSPMDRQKLKETSDKRKDDDPFAEMLKRRMNVGRG